MNQTQSKTKKLAAKSYVPSQRNSLNLGLIFYFLFIALATTTTTTTRNFVAFIQCEQHAFNEARPHRHIALSASEPDLFGEPNFQYSPPQSGPTGLHTTNEHHSTSGSSSSDSTPPLVIALSGFYRDDKRFREAHGAAASKQHSIAPRSVLRVGDHDTFVASPDNEPSSPAFIDYHSVDPLQYMQQDGIPSSVVASFEGANLLDWMEPGSGAGYENVPFDSRPDDSSAANEFAPSPMIGVTLNNNNNINNNPLMTPIFEQMPRQQQMGDNTPVLVRRLPMLVGTAGSPWRYKIPSSTFQDEDGDLRYLRSSLMMQRYVKSELYFTNGGTPQSVSGEAASMKNLQWLQYDQSSQTLYGFPTEADIGLNVFSLAVSDRWGLTNNETIKIAIRPHQSSKAITHSIKISGIEVASPRRSSSSPEVLMDLNKLVAEGVFGDRSSKNMIIQSYSSSIGAPNDIGSGEPQNSPVSSITWFNSSFPIHLCDLAGIESVFRALIDDRLLPPDWSLSSQTDNTEHTPSPTLMKSLSPHYRPSSVSIQLLGACEIKRSSDNYNNLNSIIPSSDMGLKIKTRLGKMKWKLGQPVVYRIPADVFVADNGLRSTRNFSLNLHTIDGKTLDQDPMYNFLEFEQETQTIFGLPFELTKHIGSKELLLTARHPITDERLRETFIIEIEPQDLTTINNRAFRVSLYFMTRVNIFGPREQVMLSRRMVTALDAGELDHGYDEYADFAVIDVQKFTTGSYIDNSASLSDPANAWKYQDKILPIDDSQSSLVKNSESLGSRDSGGSSSGAPDGSIFYKLTWTNETIGYRGDCPVEVIKENILYTLERNMINYIAPDGDLRPEEDSTSKNDSVRFYERLKEYFEPSIDLIHLRFEPLSACIDALELHDVGNSDLADIVDRAEDLDQTTELPLHAILTKPLEAPKPKEVLSPINSDEYWAIVVLIILVVAIFFVVMMLIMGLHTYRINQEKRFELQMKLAQARQNSMYLSSMVLADQLQPSDLAVGSQHATNLAKPVYLDERISRKPVILDNEKQLLANGSGASSPYYRPTTVRMTPGQTVYETATLKPNQTFTMDSIANMQQAMANASNPVYPEAMMTNQSSMLIDEHRHRSMTLNRTPRATNNVNPRAIAKQASTTNANHLSHSQSIITVASLGPPQVAFMPHAQANVPFVYAPMPVFYESTAEMPAEL